MANANNIIGETVFRRGVADAVYMFSDPPRVRELPRPPLRVRRRYP